jgi:hypothetical protein
MWEWWNGIVDWWNKMMGPVFHDAMDASLCYSTFMHVQYLQFLSDLSLDLYSVHTCKDPTTSTSLHTHTHYTLGCTEGEVRLVGGANSNEGRVEICLSDEWGTVCDQMWDATDARVVCRELGLGSTGS